MDKVDLVLNGIAAGLAIAASIIFSLVDLSHISRWVFVIWPIIALLWIINASVMGWRYERRSHDQR